jgi:hypothetical protein
MSAFVKVGAGVVGIVGAAVGCYFLKKSGNHVKVLKAVKTAGTAVTDTAVVATNAVIDCGSAAVEIGIAGAETVASTATAGVEATGYGLGRSARFVLDATNKAGGSVSDNPLSRGVRKGFSAPDAEIVSAPVQGNLANA